MSTPLYCRAELLELPNKAGNRFSVSGVDRCYNGGFDETDPEIWQRCRARLWQLKFPCLCRRTFDAHQYVEQEFKISNGSRERARGHKITPCPRTATKVTFLGQNSVRWLVAKNSAEMSRKADGPGDIAAELDGCEPRGKCCG